MPADWKQKPLLENPTVETQTKESAEPQTRRTDAAARFRLRLLWQRALPPERRCARECERVYVYENCVCVGEEGGEREKEGGDELEV